MQWTQSLKFKLSLGIVAVMLPLVLFTFYNNTNARNIVEEKVTETYSNTLRSFVERVDETLMEINEYLYKMDTNDADAGILKSYPYLSDTYVLTKVRIQQKMYRDIGFYDLMDTIFLYTGEDLIHASYANELITTAIIFSKLEQLIELEATQGNQEWHLLYDDRVRGGYFLVRIHRFATGVYGGAFVKISDIAEQLNILWNEGNIGQTMIYSHDGANVLEPLTPALADFVMDKIRISPDVTMHASIQPESEERYLVISQSSSVAKFAYSIIFPETTMLRNIPFLQKATYFLPLGIVLILIVFLIYLNEIVLKPLGELMRGMRKIAVGVLDARIKPNNTTEFNFLANSFNTMAQEVKHLKIDVYEEKLRVQDAEFKHLQAQISPHFYMNSLNIIYNFAALGDNDSVKKMSLHLADYFRFIMRTNRNRITLDEELQHISNYIDIQKFRFPGKLAYRVNAAEEIRAVEIPMLTLQPFVENAIIHGFKNRKQLFHIEIDAELVESVNRIVITIKDNGVGIPEDVLHALNEDKPLAESSSSRLGIRNVIHRLRLHCNGDAKLHFANNEDGGARVVIDIPYVSRQVSQGEILIQGEGERSYV